MFLQLTLVKATLLHSKASFYILLFASSQWFLHTVTAQEPTTAASRNSDDTPPDPTVALEGQCVVVCDAIKLPIIQRRQTGLTKRRSKQLAFSVLKKDNVAINQDSPYRVILFDHFLISVGNAYDMSKGTFTPTASGIYSLQFTIFKVHNRYPVTVALTVSTSTHLFCFLIW